MIMLFILLLPLLLAFGGFHRRLRPWLVSLAPWTALPALIWAAWTPPDFTFDVSWLFLGIHFGVDDIGRSSLIVTAGVWLLAGIVARASFSSDSTSHRLVILYLVTLSGMFGLCLAQDLPTFTLFYAVNTFAVYGLIIFEQTVAAHRAGLAYIILAVVGEMVLLEAILHIISIAEYPNLSQIPAVVATASERQLMIGLLLAGFGIKIGIFPLHVWIPMAYSAAPFAISAVLSGSMFLAGFLGWIRLLPLGMIALSEWGIVCMIAGTLTLLHGIGVGLTQKDPKSLLAYSTISQAGILTMSFGMGMVMPDRWPHIAPLLMLWPLHHAIAMGALFLGLGVAQKTTGPVWQCRLVAGGLVVSALALIGTPFSSGALSQAIFSISAPPTTWWAGLSNWLPALGIIGMTILMGRFLLEARPWRQGKDNHAGDRLTMRTWLPWAALIICGGILMWIMQSTLPAEAERLLWSPMAIWKNLWPIGVGGLVLWGMIRLSQGFPAPSIPPGDLVVGIQWLTDRAKNGWPGTIKATWESWRSHVTPLPLLHPNGERAVSLIEKMEERLGQWAILGTALLMLAAVFFMVLMVL
jgi:formate hydrogenlyase subunit 3/multisubunit Na+/H+ antiporter MnhD subunit